MGKDDTGPVPNDRLRFYMERKGLSAQALAERIEVDVKTVERWLTGETTPYPDNARRATAALDCDRADIWPDLFPIMTPPSAGTVAVSVYASRADVPVAVWKELFDHAVEHIDILVYGGTFLFDGIPLDSASCSRPPPNAVWQCGSLSATLSPPRSHNAAKKKA